MSARTRGRGRALTALRQLADGDEELEIAVAEILDDLEWVDAIHDLQDTVKESTEKLVNGSDEVMALLLELEQAVRGRRRARPLRFLLQELERVRGQLAYVS